MSAVSLVQFSSVSIAKLLPIGRQGLDRNLAESADAAGHEPPLHHMLTIAAMKNMHARSADDVKPYLNMFHAGFLIAADDYDWAEILELAGMPSLMVQSVQRGLSMGFIAGTLLQWQAAILRGCQKETSSGARQTYNRIYTEFKNIGLAPAFSFKSKDSPNDHTFLLEYHP
jgi:hypothetical protein